MSFELKTYYLMQASYWMQQLIILVMGVERPRKDFPELVAHVGVHCRNGVRRSLKKASCLVMAHLLELQRLGEYLEWQPEADRTAHSYWRLRLRHYGCVGCLPGCKRTRPNLKDLADVIHSWPSASTMSTRPGLHPGSRGSSWSGRKYRPSCCFLSLLADPIRYMRHYLNLKLLWSVYTEFDLIPCVNPMLPRRSKWLTILRENERNLFSPREDRWLVWW